jgi:hypothetical protein
MNWAVLSEGRIINGTHVSDLTTCYSELSSLLYIYGVHCTPCHCTPVPISSVLYLSRRQVA